MSDTIIPMTSHRPYLLRALYEWIADNGMTPHILVDATQPGVRVPPQTVKDGRVVLNIADRAVGMLTMDNHGVSFSARFGGVSQPVSVPVSAIMAIYARETGQGMVLPEDIVDSGPQPEDFDDQSLPETAGVEASGAPDAPPTDGPPKRGAHLRVVK